MDAVTIINRDKASGADVGSALRSAGIAGPVDLVEGGAISKRAGTAVEEGAKLVIVGGGDGSVSAAAAAVAGTSTRLGILPLGTLNHFARDLGLPTDLSEAAALIATGSERRVDIAEMNGRTFINNSAVGLYPLMVVDRDAQRDRLGRSKRVAMAVASIRTLARFGHQRLTLTVNDLAAQVDTPLLFVGNNQYRLEMPGAGRRDALDGGELCVLVMRSKTRAGFLAATLRALLGRARRDDMVRIDHVERLRVDSRRGRLTMSLDGEVVRGEPPLDYRIRGRALRVIAPRTTDSA